MPSFMQKCQLLPREQFPKHILFVVRRQWNIDYIVHLRCDVFCIWMAVSRPTIFGDGGFDMQSPQLHLTSVIDTNGGHGFGKDDCLVK